MRTSGCAFRRSVRSRSSTRACPSTPTHVREPRSTSSRAERWAPLRLSGPTTPTSPTTSSSSSPRSNGARRTSRWSAIRMTHSVASTSCAAAATFASSSTDGWAESSRPLLLFETLLPPRFYLPREEVTVRLEPSETATYCAYKGRASYYSIPGGPRDVAWTYHEPLHDAEPVRDRICFFDERLDVIVDGKRRDRPITPWSDD